MKATAVLLLVLACVAAASAQVPKFTHAVAGNGIFGVGEVELNDLAIWSESNGAWTANIPSPGVGAGALGVVPLGESEVLVYGNFATAAQGQAATGIVFWDGSAWCVPSELKFYKYNKASLVAANISYSCQLDHTTRGIDLSGAITRTDPCNGYPIATGNLAAGSINTVFQDPTDPNLLFFMGDFNQVNNWQGGAAGLAAVTYSPSTKQFTFATPGRPAVTLDNTPTTSGGAVVTPSANSIVYLQSPELSFNDGVGPGFRFDNYPPLDQPTKFPRDVNAAYHGTAAPCVKFATFVENNNRVFLCLNNAGNVFRMRVPATAGARPINALGSFAACSGGVGCVYWEQITQNTTDTGLIAGTVRDMAVKPGTQQVYLVGQWDTFPTAATAGGAYDGNVAPNAIPINAARRSRHIAQVTALGSDLFQVAGIPATTSNDGLFAVGALNNTQVEARGWKNWESLGQGSAAWQNTNTYNNGRGGFDSIVFGSATELWVYGGYRPSSGPGDFDKQGNILAGLLQGYVLRVNEGASGTLAPVGGTFGPYTASGPIAATQQRLQLPRTGGALNGLHYSNGVVYIVGASRQNLAITGTNGEFFNRRFTTAVDTGLMKFDGTNWVPALGGAVKGVAGTPSFAWKSDGTFYLYSNGISHGYNKYANTLAIWNGDADNNNDAWSSPLLHTSRITTRSATGNWGSAGSINGNTGVVNTIHVYDEANNARNIIFAGNFEWVGDVSAASIAHVNTVNGNVVAIGGGLWNTQLNTAQQTGSTAMQKFFTPGTVNSVYAPRSGGNAGKWVIAGGNFNSANLGAANQFIPSASCMNNLALFSDLDNEGANFKGRWNMIDGGCTGGQVRVLYHSNGFLYVGGSFSGCGAAQGSVVRIKMDEEQTMQSIVDNNRVFMTLGLGVTGGNVDAITEYDGRIYVAGSYNQAAGLHASSVIARWEVQGDNANDFGDWENVYSDCFGRCDEDRNPNNQRFQAQGNAFDPNTRRYTTGASKSMITLKGSVYVVAPASQAVGRFDGDQWSDLGAVTPGGSSFYTALAHNEKDNHLIVLGGTTNNYLGRSNGWDEWDMDEDNWVPGRGGFNGALPTVIDAGVSTTFSAALLAAVAIFALLF